MDQNNALVFIPDISGFTKFVNNTEILHARHIITELLEIIIDSNETDLEVSEIEGDAILFYRFGKPPSAGALLAQVQKMYIGFKASLKKYETQRICQCGACSSAEKLSLKFVAHYGEVVLETVKDFQKLFGSDVIVAHRLLKNNLSKDQYLLITDQLLEKAGGIDELRSKSWEDPLPGSGEYDFGKCSFSYLPLDILDSQVPEPKIEDFSLPGATMKIDEYEGVIYAPLKTTFDIVSDLSFRHRWIEGLEDSDSLNGLITKNGSSHRCVIKDNSSDPYFHSHNFEKVDDIIRFTETEQAKGISNIYSLQSIGSQMTRMTIYTFIKPNLLKKWIYTAFLKKKFTRLNAMNYENLNSYCRKLQKENKQHESQIIL